MILLLYSRGQNETMDRNESFDINLIRNCHKFCCYIAKPICCCCQQQSVVNFINNVVTVVSNFADFDAINETSDNYIG